VEAELDRVCERSSLCSNVHFTSSDPDGLGLEDSGLAICCLCRAILEREFAVNLEILEHR
jgi:hypothetical protein